MAPDELKAYYKVLVHWKDGKGLDMNKKKCERIVMTILIVLVFCIAFGETELYYRDTVSNQVYLLFLSIMNGLRIFTLKSTLSFFDVIKVDAEHIGLAGNILRHAYIVCYFVAPLITVKYITKLLNYLSKGRLSLGVFSKKERIIIVGYNKYVEILVRDIIDSNKRTKKLIILHRDEIPERKRIEFQMSGVLFKEYEKLDYDKEENRKTILKWLRPKKVKHIILFEEKDMDNFSNYCFFLKCFETNDAGKFRENVKIDCNYNSSQVEQLIWNCYDQKKDIFKHDLNTFSIPMLRAQSVLNNRKVYEDIADEQGDYKDIHLLVIGFGRMGRRFFKRAVNQGVVSDKNRITVDIVEKDIEQTKWHFERWCKDYYDSKDNTIRIGSETAEGELQIRLHGHDIKDIRFAECMERISTENPFTYIAICIDDPDESVNCMLQVVNYLQKKEQNVPVLMRMDSGQQLNELKIIYDNLHLVPGDDEIISIENIRSEELKLISESIHKKDDRVQKYRTKYAYQVESSKYRVLHYDAKDCVVKKLEASDKGHISEMFKLLENADKIKREEFINKIKEDKWLFKLGAIEHRRWSYYMVLSGWTYGEVKDEEKKVTPYLCPFSTILDSSELKINTYYEYKDWNEIITKKE